MSSVTFFATCTTEAPSLPAGNRERRDAENLPVRTA